MKIIDSHAHLEEVKDLEGALKRAKQTGVAAVVAVGVDIKSSEKALEICRVYKDPGVYPIIYPSLGIHPKDLKLHELPSVFKLIEENIDNIVAVGEIGLDYWYKEARKEGPGRRLQKEIFVKQLDIANRYNKPVIIHSRGAWKDCFEIMVQRRIKRGVFHWYSGPGDVLEDVLKRGYFISVTPSCEYSKEHQEAVKKTPLENILIETDSPVVYKPQSGKYESEPKDVLRALKAVSEIKDIEEARIARKSTENAMELFGFKLS